MSLSNPQNPPLVNEAVAKSVSTNVEVVVDENRTKVNQIHGINPSGSVGAGIPKPVNNVSASMTNASVGSTSTVTVYFRRDPSDKNFSRVVIFAKGYQGNNTPVQVGSGADSPATVILNNTGESVSIIVQSVGNGGSSPFSSSPTCAIKLPKNPNGGAGTQTVTNLTVNQIPTSTSSGALSISHAAAPGTVNLTTDGTFDWFIFGGGFSASQVDSKNSFIWKFTGGGFTQQNLTFISTILPTDATLQQAHTGGPIAFSATDAAISPQFSGIIVVPLSSYAPYVSVSGTIYPFGYQFSVESNSVQRTMNLYIGGGGFSANATLTVTAHLMDGSAVDVSTSVVGTVSGAAGPGYLVTIIYKSANPTKLLVSAMVTNVASVGFTGLISFFGVTIS